jgi:tetratricopeptide (TPR) repeat protein
VSLVVGCAAPRPTNEFLRLYDQANIHERHDRPAEAAAVYGKAASVAGRPRTRWQAAYRQARQLEKAGESAEAERLYLHIAETDPGGEMASRCWYYTGRIAWERGDLDTALTRLRRVMEEYHEKGLAPQAVRRAVQWISERQGPEQAIEFLREEEPRVEGTDVLDSLLFQWARLEEDQGRWERALELLERLVELYPRPRSTIWDDALWLAGNIARAQGDPQRAIGYLEEIVEWREDSIPTGTYYTTFTDNSQLLIGRIYLEDLQNPARAAEAFELLVTFPDSRLADDGLWWASRAYLQLGDSQRACNSLERLLRDFPYSNQQRHARRSFSDLGC